MRIAVVSDVHGNLTALEAVIADLEGVSPDVVINGGDLAGSGARPAEVVDRVAGLEWPGVVGNTDEVLWNPRPLLDLAERLPDLAPTWDRVLDDAAWTLGAVGAARVQWLKCLPMRCDPPGVTVVHAGPNDTWNSPTASATDADLAATYGALAAAVVVYGHLHTPFIRDLPGFRVANSGSVGLPYDGDPRASYLLIEDGRLTIRRVAYDVEAEVAALAERRHPNADWIAGMLRTGRYAHPTG